jgi:hypothetical protein
MSCIVCTTSAVTRKHIYKGHGPPPQPSKVSQKNIHFWLNFENSNTICFLVDKKINFAFLTLMPLHTNNYHANTFVSSSNIHHTPTMQLLLLQFIHPTHGHCWLLFLSFIWLIRPLVFFNYVCCRGKFFKQNFKMNFEIRKVAWL